MITAIIIEDEKHCIARLQQLLRNFSDKIRVKGEYDSVAESLVGIKRIKPDLIFMDVELKDGDCFDLLKKIKNPSFEIIFTTAHHKYAIDAFNYAAIHYLLKPIDSEQFNESVRRCLEKMNYQQTNLRLESMIHNIVTHSFQEKQIVFPSIKDHCFHKPGEILRLQAEGNYCSVKLLNGKFFLATKSIKYYEGLLNPDVFFRIHQSHLINLSYVDKYIQKKGGSYVKLSTGEEVPVSVRKGSALLKFLSKNNQL